MAVALVLVVRLLTIVSGQTFDLHNPLKVGKTFMAGSTDPTSGSTAWALTSHGISENLFTVDESGNIVPQVATSVTKTSTLLWEVKLKDDYYFSDGTKVTAQLVRDALTELNTKNSNAQASLGTMTVTALDDLTLTIGSEMATPVMDAVLAEWPFVVYKKEGSDSYIFTGPFAVETFVEGESIKLIPNAHYPRSSERPLVVIEKFPDGSSLGAALGRGELDLAFHLPVEDLNELRQNAGLTIKSFEVGYHYMMWHNTRTSSQLEDPKVRQAVDIALDRTALTQELRGGMATRSLFPDYSPYFLDTSEQHGQKTAAEALLEEAGWFKDDATNVRMKGEVNLTLRVVAYPQRPGLVLMLPLIEDVLVSLGITVDAHVTDGASWDELDQIMADKDYDLLLWAQNTLPAGDPQWFLNAFFRTDAGSNHAGLRSSAVDEKLDDLALAAHETRESASDAAHTAILAEVPVSNLCTPEWHVGLSSRLSTYKPWGSDYYIIRSDLGLSETPTTTAETPTTTGSDGSDGSDGETNTNRGSRVISGGCSLALFLLPASRFVM